MNMKKGIHMVFNRRIPFISSSNNFQKNFQKRSKKGQKNKDIMSLF